MNEEQKEILVEVSKDLYKDGIAPIIKPTGEVIGLIPRTIRAILSPLEKWVLRSETNIRETEKLLAEKLKNVNPELLETPETHIAVPALQYISYCMDNEELRNMYANLLASSMNKEVKNSVHPSFVEVIKQLCPDEAKILSHLALNNKIPIITLYCCNNKGYMFEIVKNFSNIDERARCENLFEINKYFENLERLGLIKISSGIRKLSKTSLYDELKHNNFILEKIKDIENKIDEYNIPKIVEGYICVTDYGKEFCKTCVIDEKYITFEFVKF